MAHDRLHAGEHVDGTDDIQSATDAQKGLATAAQITMLETHGARHTDGNDDIQDAGAAQKGLLTAAAQTIGGAKTFNALINALGGIANSAAELLINFDAAQDAGFFGGAANNETPSLKVSGYFNGDALRAVLQGIVAADTYGWTGASNYTFDGKVGVGVAPTEQLTALDTLGVRGATNPIVKVVDTTSNIAIILQSFNADAWVGTQSNHPLRLVANNTEWVTLTPTGDVGIGLTVPLAKLDVVGTTRLGDSATNYFAASATGDTHFVGSAGMPYGEIWVKDNAVETAIGGAGTFVQFTGFVNNGSSNNTTPDEANDHIGINIAGDYLVTLSAHVSNVVAAGPDMGNFSIRKNNGTVAFDNLHVHQRFAAGPSTEQVISISGILPNLAVDDTVELWITNDDAATNLLVVCCNLTILQIGGAG